MKVRHLKRRTARFQQPLPERFAIEAMRAIPHVVDARSQISDFGHAYHLAVERDDGGRHAVRILRRRNWGGAGYKQIAAARKILARFAAG